MNTSGDSQPTYVSIGEVLAELRPEFPDITISKLRFLESEGLIEPERTSSGYRKYATSDIERLRYVLSAQRDHYLPLRVIREQLDAGEGLRANTKLAQRPSLVAVKEGDEQATAPTSQFTLRPAVVRLSRVELIAESGITETQLTEAEHYGLVTADNATYDEDAVAVASAVAQLARFGVEARHLRAHRGAVDREIGLWEQVLSPLLHHSGPQAHGQAETKAAEIAELSMQLHAALLQARLRQLR